MSILRHIVGIAAELLTLNDPYDVYIPPKIISDNGDVQIVRASNHADATRHLQGTTISGNRSVVATRTGPRTWNVHTEDWTDS